MVVPWAPHWDLTRLCRSRGMSMVSRLVGSRFGEPFSTWSAPAGWGAGSVRAPSDWCPVPRTNRSASGPSAGVARCSGRLNLLFASAIGEPHQLFDQAPNLLGGLPVARTGLLHLDDGEAVASGLGVA